MKIFAIAIVMCFFSHISYANSYDQQIQIQRQIEASTAAINHTAIISPDVLRKTEELMKKSGIKLDDFWHSDSMGFAMIATTGEGEDCFTVIITWNGTVVKKVTSAWSGRTTFSNLWTWDDIK